MPKRHHNLINNFVNANGAAQESEFEAGRIAREEELSVKAIEFCAAHTSCHGGNIVYISSHRQ